MGFRLQIIFRGLCVFVNSSESNRSTETTAVFLIDGRAPGCVDERVRPEEYAGKPHFSHVPAVKFFVGDLDNGINASEARPDFSFSRRSGENEKGVWILDGDDLSIEQLPEGNVELGASFLEFIPSIEKFHGDRLKVKPECFRKAADLISDLTEVGLVGRLRLRGGEFVGDFRRIDPDLARVDPDTRVIDPESGKENFAVFEAGISGPVVVIRSSKGTALALAPKGASGDSKVTVVIENVPPPKIVTVDDYAYDFELIYRIADGLDGNSVLNVEPLDKVSDLKRGRKAAPEPSAGDSGGDSSVGATLKGTTTGGTSGPCGASRFAADLNAADLFNQ